MTGRKIKLTEELTQNICENIELGMSYTLTAQAAGIAYNTFNHWMQKGEAGDKNFIDFYNRVRAAEAECARQSLERIRDAAKEGTWNAAAWLLERRYPADYGKRESVNMKALTENLNVNVDPGEAEAESIRSEILRRLRVETESDS